MTSYMAIVSAAVYLALNLIIFGAVTALATLTVFWIIPAALPRARYLVAIAAFCAASALPIMATLGLIAGSKSPSPPAIEASVGDMAPGEANATDAGDVPLKSSPPALASIIARRLAS